MVEPGQLVTQALKAEFGEEAMAKLNMSPNEREEVSKQIEKLFQNGEEVSDHLFPWVRLWDAMCCECYA